MANNKVTIEGVEIPLGDMIKLCLKWWIAVMVSGAIIMLPVALVLLMGGVFKKGCA